jgi:hypothetical protein
MSRSYFTPQGGRVGKSGVKDEDKWGVSTSQAEFKGYEAAEMKNARDLPRHSKPCMQTSSDRGTQPKVKGPPNYAWHRFQESFPDHSMRSAYTASEQSAPRQSQGGSKSSKKVNAIAGPPAWATTHMNPIPERKFDATSSYDEHQRQAQQARHGHFPYRDEFAPRSKRLLYELAHQNFSRDSVASGSTVSASAFTMSSRGARSVARSNSDSSLASSHHTADTNRVVGGVAKRRREATFRSPSLWPPDQDWLNDKWQKEGPQGLTFANFKPSFYQRTCQGDVEQTLAIRDLLCQGVKEADMKG